MAWAGPEAPRHQPDGTQRRTMAACDTGGRPARCQRPGAKRKCCVSLPSLRGGDADGLDQRHAAGMRASEPGGPRSKLGMGAACKGG